MTPREREVLALVAEGKSNAAIARQLWVTEKTVETPELTSSTAWRLSTCCDSTTTEVPGCVTGFFDRALLGEE